MEARQKLSEISDRYSIDKREFGKVLTVASIAIFVVSVHSAMEFGKASEDLKKVNRGFDKTSGVINSEGFNQSIEALESLKGTDIAPQFIRASKAFRSAQANLEKSEMAQNRLEESFETYRWLVLISILGTISGITVIYI